MKYSSMKPEQPRILVVDDTETNVDILIEALGNDYDVSVAMDGKQALQLLEKDLPDLILLDILMPGMDGYEVIQRIKADARTREISVVFISALQETNQKIQGLALGAVDYITKPFDVEEVRARVERQLELHEVKRRLIEQNQRLMRRNTRQSDQPLVAADRLAQLIRSGESQSVEFKSTLRWNLKIDSKDLAVEMAWLKTIVAFLNSNGGTLLVGVDDEGSVVGYEKDAFANEDKYLLYVNNRIRQNIGLEFAPYIRFALVPIDHSKVLVVDCTASETPVFLINGNDETFFVRLGPGSRKLSPRQTLAYLSSRKPL
jgi:putative two-component system response regulator